MPLPAGGAVPWPPPECEQINAQYATWAAWYAGDTEQLAGIYGGGKGADTTGFFASEAGGWRAAIRGVVSGLRRWFWGSRGSGNQERQRLHVPIAADIASASSDLLFAEPPTVTVPEDPAATKPAEGETAAPDPTQVALDELMDDGTQACLLEAAEICAALGGVYLRVVWDKAARDKPWLTAVHPDAAVPEWQWGQLKAVTFWRVILTKGKIVVRHLERHEPGKILHGVYQGTNDELGTPMSLGDYPETKGIVSPDLVDGNTIVLSDPKLMTAEYVPNMKPNRIWRNVPHAAHLGRSDYAGVEQMMDALDLTWSSLIRDVDLGKARLVVPKEYMQSHGAGNGASVDLDQELYEPIDVMSREDGVVSITQVQFAIRVDDHTKVIDALKASIVGAAGYSGRTFGLAGDAAITATEVAATERRSFITRDRKIRYWRPALAASLYALLTVYRDVFKAEGVEPVLPLIDFADGVSVDPKALAEEINLLSAAGAISTEEMVRKRRPDWDDPKVLAEVEKIDKARQVEDPATFTGGKPFGDQDDDEDDPKP